MGGFPTVYAKKKYNVHYDSCAYKLKCVYTDDTTPINLLTKMNKIEKINNVMNR